MSNRHSTKKPLTLFWGIYSRKEACVKNRSWEMFESLPYLPLKDMVLLCKGISTALSRGRRLDPVVPSPLMSLLIPSGHRPPHGERKSIKVPLWEASAGTSNQRPKCWGTISENPYSSPTTPYPGQEFSLQIPWELGCRYIPHYK